MIIAVLIGDRNPHHFLSVLCGKRFCRSLAEVQSDLFDLLAAVVLFLFFHNPFSILGHKAVIGGIEIHDFFFPHTVSCSVLPADDHMIQTADTHELACRDYPFCQCDIFLRRRRVSARMVVHQQKTGRITEQAALKDVGYVSEGLIDRPHADNIEIDGFQPGIEIYDAEHFPVILRKLLPHDIHGTVRRAHWFCRIQGRSFRKADADLMELVLPLLFLCHPHPPSGTPHG